MARSEEPAPEGVTYEYPMTWIWRVRLGVACACLIVLVAAYSAAFEPPADRDEWWTMVALGAGSTAAAAALLWYHRQISCSFAAGDAGVTEWRNGRSRTLSWAEIRRIRYGRLTGFLDLEASSGGRTLRVGSAIDGFEALRHFAAARSGRVIEDSWR